MTEVSCYHLQKSRLDDALPKLLEKTLSVGKRAVVMLGSVQRVEQLTNQLWVYDQDSWLPHGSSRDGRAEDHPVWLTVEDENPNGASFLFLADGATSKNFSEYERCFELFDGNDGAQVSAARERWKTYKDAGYSLKYLQQTEQGGWEEKVST